MFYNFLTFQLIPLLKNYFSQFFSLDNYRTFSFFFKVVVKFSGVSKLMDVLGETREVLRNDALIVLFKLTKGQTNKTVYFIGYFD